VVESYNGEPINTFGKAVIKDLPGNRNIHFRSRGIFKKDGVSYIIDYKFNVSFRAGYSYNYKSKKLHYDTVSEDHEMCLIEDNHFADGSSVNVTGEYRTPSKEAKEVSCTKAIFVPLS